MNSILMPKSTAIWMIDNTALTFHQIADFCNMHILEIEAIANGDVASKTQGTSPISNHQLSREEITRCEQDPTARLQLLPPPLTIKKQKKAFYTPIAKRQDKPNAIAWITKHHPYVRDTTIIELIGTTKNTIKTIRDRSHWNIKNIEPKDPVNLGFCTQSRLNECLERDSLLDKQKSKPTQSPYSNLNIPKNDSEETKI